MNLAIGLPLRDRAGLTNLLQELYDPASPNFHQFLTPDQFAQRFGPSESDYAAVVNFAQTHGLAVTAQYSNRMVVSVRGTVADVERAFNVTINEYQHPTESRTFFAPAGEPSLDLTVPVLHVSGLDNYVMPHTCLKAVSPIKPLSPNQPKPQATGSGPSGSYMGKDFRAAYAPGVTLTGTGQAVGLFELDSGFYQSDIAAYELQGGLPNVPVATVLLDGYGGGPGEGNDEVSLDIEMAISMAPGLNEVVVYEGSTPDDIFNRMASDNICKELSASWTYPIDSTSDQDFMEFAAQGQSFFNASGDGGAYSGSPYPPTDNPYVTVVGGTTLTVATAGGAWSSETTWSGSGGGISTTFAIPSWQQGISMAANGGSTALRNLPDVALIANNVFLIFNNGEQEVGAGTSCATPLWAAFVALANQLAVANSQPLVGFLNPAVYAMGKGSNSIAYTSLFHDITTGNDENSSSPSHFRAAAGYDLCTGWGTPAGSNLLTALALPEPLRINPTGGIVFSGPAGGPFSPVTSTSAYALSDSGGNAINWSLGNTSAWFNASVTSGALSPNGPATSVSVSLTPAVSSLPAGDYTASLLFTNLSDNYVQARQVTLAVVTPPEILIEPTNEAAIVGSTATFSVLVASNALVYYQWQENGASLTDGGQIAGSATSTLTISNVTPANAGSYSLIVSNVTGVVVSTNALLTVISSPPIIIQQPTNQTILQGAPAAFSVAAAGNTPYTFRWQLNGTNLINGLNYGGVTTSTLMITNAEPTNAGIYTVTVTNSLGGVVSTGALLTLEAAGAPGFTLNTIWTFTGGTSGQNPLGPLAEGKNGDYYGTTAGGGASSDGTIFRVAPNGSLVTLFSFSGNNGTEPYAGLYLAKDGNFYGDALIGGNYNYGTAFKITSGGTYTELVGFNGYNGEEPVANPVQGNSTFLYGTANAGGAYGYGTIFQMTTSGTISNLVSFNGANGAYPSPVLAFGANGNFYGTAESGGTNGEGTVFEVSPSGQLTILHEFNGITDGAVPIAGVVLGVDGNIYGVTLQGGADDYGTVFKLTPAGVLTTLYNFTGGNDGAYPWGGLIQATDGNLYGTTQSGGTYDYGTVFQIAPTGPLNTIVQFNGFAGATPYATLLQGSDGSLYGTTEAGGSLGEGTVFRLSINGPLQITGQPVDQPASLGGSAIFTVATSGGAPVTYQWLQDGVPLTNGVGITGANSATLTISNVSFADAALYSVVVGNSTGSVTSDEAVLEVIYAPPSITTQPFSQTVVAGTPVTLSVTASGNQPLTYQWRENGTNLTDGGGISGSATTTLSLANVSVASSGTYSVIVSNSLFAVSSTNAVLMVVPATPAFAATTSLHSFTGGTDGAYPYGGVIQGRDGNLYGMDESGGTAGAGVVFKATLAGTMTPEYGFLGGTNGQSPYGGLVQGANNNFYGSTLLGGADSAGNLFSMTNNGTVTSLYSFTGGSDGAEPVGSLILASDGNFYGTALEGGSDTNGTVYRMTPSGAETTLYQFTGGADGGEPYAPLIQARDGNFYGTTLIGGANGDGVIFRMSRAGTLTTIVSFNYTNGAEPQGGLVQAADGNLYGTTLVGGSIGYGTVFRVTTNGVLTTLFSFGATNGANPAASLVQGTDGNLYGTTAAGGAGNQGTAFRITTNGLLTTLVWFDGFNGANPQAALVQASDGNFYGTAPYGGPGYNPTAGGGNGTLFRITVPIFATNQFTAAPGIAALPYSATIAVRTDAPGGDSLTFSKVSGPAWLNVATNGALSGTPADANIGTNVFAVALTDANGVSATATMFVIITPDPAPTFLANPFSEPAAAAGAPYAATIATNATAPYLSEGDVLTFAMVSGPAWLNVAPTGLLSGTPSASDAGTDTFVVSATDLGGNDAFATLMIYVTAPLTGAISTQGTNISFTWSGGTPPYQIQMTTSLVNPVWQNVGGPTSTTTLLISPTNSAAFYRILEQ